MSERRRMKHTTSLEDRIAERLTKIKARAEALPLDRWIPEWKIGSNP